MYSSLPQEKRLYQTLCTWINSSCSSTLLSGLKSTLWLLFQLGTYNTFLSWKLTVTNDSVMPSKPRKQLLNLWFLFKLDHVNNDQLFYILVIKIKV